MNKDLNDMLDKTINRFFEALALDTLADLQQAFPNEDVKSLILERMGTQVINPNKSTVVLDYKMVGGISESIIIDKATMGLFIENYILSSKCNKINDLRKKIMADI